jgi:beclin
LNYTFRTAKLLFAGPAVRLEKNKDKQILELSADPDATFIRLFANRRFDNAMGAFLQLVQELVAHVQSMDASFKPPYEISTDKIDGKSIRMQFNSEEIWTKALKFMLTDMKWILSWMTAKGFA